MTNPLKALNQYGQSVWLDAISRSLIQGGTLQQLIDEDGLTGVTSNPTIFAKAIADSTDYDEALHRVLRLNPMVDNPVLAERLMLEDIRMAAELLRPIYHRTDGADGFVSLEVSAAVAHDTDATVAQARRLWFEVARPNVMIKVPATPESVPAIEMLIAQGINVNITLMFSLEHYEAVAHAYLRGLAGHADPRCVSSVASVFVSRLDAVADRQLEVIGSAEALALRGKTAIANAQRIYQRFREIFYGEAFADLARRGARVQRPLWASTGTKNPSVLRCPLCRGADWTRYRHDRAAGHTRCLSRSWASARQPRRDGPPCRGHTAGGVTPRLGCPWPHRAATDRRTRGVFVVLRPVAHDGRSQAAGDRRRSRLTCPPRSC